MSNVLPGYYYEYVPKLSMDTLSDIKESLAGLKHMGINIFLEVYKNTVAIIQDWYARQEQDNLMLWVLFGSSSLLLALLVSSLMRRIVRNRDQVERPSAATPEGSAATSEGSAGVSAEGSAGVSADGDLFQPAREETSTCMDVFFPLSPKLCHKANISIPKGMAVKSSQVWDISLGPVKRGLSLSPSILLPQKRKKGRIAVEIVGPANQKTVDLSPPNRRHFVVSLSSLSKDDDEEEEEEDPRSGGAYLGKTKLGDRG